MSHRVKAFNDSQRLQQAAFTALCVGVTLLLAISGCQHGSGSVLTDFREAAVRRSLERGDALIAQQDREGAAQVYQDALRKNPNHPALNARLGHLYFQNGEYERAAGFYRTALKADSNCFHYALSLAQCQSRLAATSLDRDRQMEAAARAFQFAQSLDPQNFTATIQLAMCYREMGDFGQATTILMEAVRQHPQAAIIHTQLGEIYHSQNDLDHALAEFKTALTCDSKDLAAHNGCAVVNTAIAQAGGSKSCIARERAVAHFRRSLQLNSQQPQVRAMLEQLEAYEWKAVTVTEDPPQ